MEGDFYSKTLHRHLKGFENLLVIDFAAMAETMPWNIR